MHMQIVICNKQYSLVSMKWERMVSARGVSYQTEYLLCPEEGKRVYITHLLSLNLGRILFAGFLTIPGNKCSCNIKLLEDPNSKSAP